MFSVARGYGHHHQDEQEEIQVNRNSAAFFIVFVIFVVFVVFFIKFIPQCHSWVDFNAFAEISGYSESNAILFAHLFQLWVANVAEVGKFAIYFALVNVCTLICKRKESL